MALYFDNAATTPLDPKVIEAMTDCLSDIYGNPSSIHASGRKARSVIELSRKKIANYLDASIGEIFFTSGGTESNNMALICAVRDLGVKRIITSKIEHHCILHTVEALQEEHDLEVSFVLNDSKGRMNMQHLEDLLQGSKSPTLVSLMHANNEIGTLMDLEKIGTICRKYGAYFHSDTVQTMAHFPISVDGLPIDFLSGSAHKFHGPKGVGFIYINGDNKIKPMIHGGAQERNMRAGTENIHGIVGLAKAFELALEEMVERKTHIEGVRSYLKAQLMDYFPEVKFLGDHDGDFLYTVLSVSFPPSEKSELLLLNLDIYGICASGGSACSSGAAQVSHVISAINSDKQRKVVRFSFSHYNTKGEVDQLIDKLKVILGTTLRKIAV